MLDAAEALAIREPISAAVTSCWKSTNALARLAAHQPNRRIRLGSPAGCAVPRPTARSRTRRPPPRRCAAPSSSAACSPNRPEAAPPRACPAAAVRHEGVEVRATTRACRRDGRSGPAPGSSRRPSPADRPGPGATARIGRPRAPSAARAGPPSRRSARRAPARRRSAARAARALAATSVRRSTTAATSTPACVQVGHGAPAIVAAGHHHRPATRRHREPVHIGPHRAGQHHARPVVAGEHQRPLHRARRQHAALGDDLPVALPRLVRRRIGEMVRQTLDRAVGRRRHRRRTPWCGRRISQSRLASSATAFAAQSAPACPRPRRSRRAAGRRAAHPRRKRPHAPRPAPPPAPPPARPGPRRSPARRMQEAAVVCVRIRLQAQRARGRRRGGSAARRPSPRTTAGHMNVL